MSASDECRTLLLLPPPHSLYCNETASDVLLDHVSSCGTDTCDGHGTLDTLDDEDEDSVECMFDSELDRMLSVTEISDLREVVAAAHRDDAVHWMFEKNKAWAIQLAAIACLAVAVKMEEREVPFLLDLQIKKPKFLFKPKTIQRMELVVMGNLKWRLRIITPFNFLPYFTSNLLSCSLPTKSCCFTCILSLASHLIITTCTEIDFLEYHPSTIAASVVLCVTDEVVDDQKLGCLHKRVNKEMVKRCCSLIKRKYVVTANHQMTLHSMSCQHPN